MIEMSTRARDLKEIFMIMKVGFNFCRNIDNTSIQCSHGKVPVSKVNFMKRLSAEAWTMIMSKVLWQVCSLFHTLL